MSGPNWSDLKTRVLSAFVMVAVLLAAVFAGPKVLSALICLAIVPMAWEISRLGGVSGPRMIGVVLAMAGAMVGFLAWENSLNWLFIVIGAGAIYFLVAREQIGLALYGAAIILATLMMSALAITNLNGLLILLTIVVLSDVFGYFAGRTLGGPKFWPAISPKKTWSGTIAGWIAAAIFAIILAMFGAGLFTDASAFVLLALGAQMGDIAESALKRRTGVKDSSNLIPGHGGFLDRFDGMIGAALVLAGLGYLGIFTL